MHVGSVPFFAKAETKVFDLILNRQFGWPKDKYISPQAKDLVNKLL
jgi:hypothetical protein